MKYARTTLCCVFVGRFCGCSRQRNTLTAESNGGREGDKLWKGHRSASLLHKFTLSLLFIHCQFHESVRARNGLVHIHKVTKKFPILESYPTRNKS